jgi:L-Ala-D/L-Glu epimerase
MHLDTRSRSAHGDVRYSGVLSAEAGWRWRLSLLKLRLYGIKHVKLKVNAGDPLPAARLARKILGRKAVLRLDANMAWTASEARAHIRALQQLDIYCVEQPLPASNLEDAAMLVRETPAEIIADEGFTDGSSLARLLAARACRGVNVRISKCGGLVAAARRCEEAKNAGLLLQVGCLVGESSLLSAAHRILISGVGPPQYAEGCYGKHLLRVDPVLPGLQLGYGGRPPRLPDGYGLGVQVQEAGLDPWVKQRALVRPASENTQKKGKRYVACRQISPVLDRLAYD